jgi:Mor family transcriptional regulator
MAVSTKGDSMINYEQQIKDIKERQVRDMTIFARYKQGVTQAQLSRDYKISRERIRQIIKAMKQVS